MNIGGIDVVAGPRIVWWACRNGCGVVEWHEDSGKAMCCPTCSAPPGYGKQHGIYTITSVGCAAEPWTVTR